MRGIVVYDTSYGNTKKVAETIAETLKTSGVDADLFSVKEVKKLNPQEYQFLVLGSPTRFGTMSLSTKFFFGKLKGEEWANKPFAAFDTENPENLEKNEWSAAEKIAERLKEKNMKQLLPTLKALVFEMKGPLKEGEIERTQQWARDLASTLKKGNA